MGREENCLVKRNGLPGIVTARCKQAVRYKHGASNHRTSGFTAACSRKSRLSGALSYLLSWLDDVRQCSLELCAGGA